MYRFKYYWAEGYESFREVGNQELGRIFLMAHQMVQNSDKLKKIDVYYNDRIIATFY